MEEKAEGMLSPYRALDLTDEKGLICGKMLGDLGADVIKIERPSGDPARFLGPFYHDEPDPEKSLFWFAYNNNKRGITLNIETADGQEIFKRLVKSADWVIESFPPGYLNKLGLGYSALEKLNPGIILVSITPFGQTGPYKDYKAPDIVAWAMGGQMYVMGDPDRRPVRISYHPQAYLHAGADAAAGALMALYHRGVMGEGQWVNVSIQEAVIHANGGVFGLWNFEKEIQKRGSSTSWKVRVRLSWPCKDGYILWRYRTGVGGNHMNAPFLKWMDDEGMSNDFLKSVDWDTLDLNKEPQELVDRLEEPMGKFFMAHTKAEIYEESLKRDALVYPVTAINDISKDVQLAAREYWVEVEHPELGTTITYPGPFAKTAELPPRISRRAPLIGEHNQEIYEKELGISREELVVLKEAQVI